MWENERKIMNLYRSTHIFPKKLPTGKKKYKNSCNLDGVSHIFTYFSTEGVPEEAKMQTSATK